MSCGTYIALHAQKLMQILSIILTKDLGESPRSRTNKFVFRGRLR